MTYEALEALGRERLSRSFYMREFLYSEIANWHQLRNAPHYPEHALRLGRELCTELLEPLQMRFGRIHIRSGYRSPEVNGFGNEHDLNCASNEKNYGEHIWDYPDEAGHYGAAACVVVPVLADYIAEGGSWTAMAWWIHDHLPYGSLCFFSKLGAFNIGWHEAPKRRIDSYTTPRGCLTKPRMGNYEGDHLQEYQDLLAFVDTGVFHARPIVAALDEGAREPVLNGESSVQAVRAKLRPSSDDGFDGRIHYRAVHRKTSWRRANGHVSMDNAIHGKDGAAGLFARRVRINYETHGEPLFVVIWRDGDPSGKVVRPHPEHVGEVELATIPVAHIELMEAQRGAVTSELLKYFA